MRSTSARAVADADTSRSARDCGPTNEAGDGRTRYCGDDRHANLAGASQALLAGVRDSRCSSRASRPGQVLVRLVQVRDPAGHHRDLPILRRDPPRLRRDPLRLLADQHDQLIAGQLRRGRHPVITAAPDRQASPTRRATPVTAATPVTDRYPSAPINTLRAGAECLRRRPPEKVI